MCAGLNVSSIYDKIIISYCSDLQPTDVNRIHLSVVVEINVWTSERCAISASIAMMDQTKKIAVTFFFLCNIDYKIVYDVRPIFYYVSHLYTYNDFK